MPNSLQRAITADQPARPADGRSKRTNDVNGLSGTSSQDTCPLKDRGCLAAQRQPSRQLLTSHSTSAGEVEYSRFRPGVPVRPTARGTGPSVDRSQRCSRPNTAGSRTSPSTKGSALCSSSPQGVRASGMAALSQINVAPRVEVVRNSR